MSHHHQILEKLALTALQNPDGNLRVTSPINGEEIARLTPHTPEETEKSIHKAYQAFLQWRMVPAPKRGELIRLFGDVLRQNKDTLGHLVTLECGKILEEGKGEVQEMIDICDFAVGLSRQLYGLTIASERPGHRMMETWHPLGPVAVISAFNFPVAVWAWNFTLAIVCGNSVIWKPSEKAPLCALACQKLFQQAVDQYGRMAPDGLSQVLIGDRSQVGDTLVSSPQIPLISATGSCRMGREVGPRVAERFGRSLLELGGNNAMIVCPSADLEMATRAILFSAVGTAGQRCTSLRRVIAHKEIYPSLVKNLKKAYQSIKIGNPLEPGTLMGPLIDERSYKSMQTAMKAAQQQGGLLFGGERTLVDVYPDAYYVTPAIAEMPAQTAIMKEETFSPLLYVVQYQNFADALDIHNGVSQGLSSCIFTTDLREAEIFLSVRGSDCGIANVNIGPSGAEIGGAFGGEKETGGGRESGSDAWRSYMRRSTNTINYSHELPLAQGISFQTN